MEAFHDYMGHTLYHLSVSGYLVCLNLSSGKYQKSIANSLYSFSRSINIEEVPKNLLNKIPL